MRTNPNQFEINGDGRDNSTWSSTPASDRMRASANDLAETENIYEEDCACGREPLTPEDREKRIEELDELIHDKIGDGKYDENGNLRHKEEYTLTDEERMKVTDTTPLDPAADKVADPINVNSSEIISEPVAISDPLASKETTTEDGDIPVNDIDDTLMDRLDDVDCGCADDVVDTTAGSETGEIMDPGYPEDVMTTTTRSSALIDDGDNIWIVESVETTMGDDSDNMDDMGSSDISAAKENETSEDETSQNKLLQDGASQTQASQKKMLRNHADVVNDPKVETTK
ncbi:MAG: hypothetical protein LUD15_04085 [Bacteroides sp.]|nr:hypothetical protein [Bacteroides sp.]